MPTDGWQSQVEELRFEGAGVGAGIEEAGGQVCRVGGGGVLWHVILGLVKAVLRSRVTWERCRDNG